MGRPGTDGNFCNEVGQGKRLAWVVDADEADDQLVHRRLLHEDGAAVCLRHAGVRIAYIVG